MWCMQQLDTLAWWQELKEVPGQDNLQEFARRVQVSFQVPKARCYASKVDNDYSAPPAHHSLDRDPFLPLLDMWFGSQDFWLTQPQKTLAYVKAIQYWAEKAQPPIPGEPHQLAESMLELWWTMELLTMFTDKEVLSDILPSNWVNITPSTSAKPTQEHSCSSTHQAHVKESFLVAYGEGWWQPLHRWPANKPLWPRRWCHDGQNLVANPLHPHQGLWRLINPCMGITHWG